LPAARASHIVAARKIKHLMTGDLGSPVLSTPWFPGKERHFLRAQIARITATCTLAVAGYYEPDDAEEAKKNSIRVVEGALEAFPGHEALATLEGWVHSSPALLSTGKSGWPDLDSLEEGTLPEETINAINAQKDAEPEKAMLEGVGPDLEELKPEEAEGSPAWNIKVYGDKGQYTFPDNAKSYRITAVRSLIWPGAVTVAQGTRFANLYVGYGQKCATLVDPYKESGLPLTGASAFSSGNFQLPLAPEDVMGEPDDQEEQEEPQPPLMDEASDGEDMEPADE
jgi:radial spoke head protein 4A